MKRQFKLIAHRRIDSVVAGEFALDRVTSPTGFGFSQKVIVQETDTVDYVVSQVMKKKPIKLQVSFVQPNAYEQAEAFQAWLGAFIDLKNYRMVLQYTHGYSERQVDVFIDDYELIALEGRVVSVQLTIQPLSPSYLPVTQTITIVNSTENKSYPYTYPYSYGGGQLEGNEIQNTFIAALPLVVTFRGKIVNPECSLQDESGTVYTTIKFTGMTLQAGQRIIVDGINQRITFFATEGATTGTDYFNEIDKTEDTFLRLKPGISTVIANLDAAEVSNPSVEITYVQYVV